MDANEIEDDDWIMKVMGKFDGPVFAQMVYERAAIDANRSYRAILRLLEAGKLAVVDRKLVLK